MDEEWCGNGCGMNQDQAEPYQDSWECDRNSRNEQGILQEFRNGQGMDKESSRNGGGV